MTFAAGECVVAGRHPSTLMIKNASLPADADLKPYRFFYRVREDTAWIVALWHGAQIPDEPDDS